MLRVVNFFQAVRKVRVLFVVVGFLGECLLLTMEMMKVGGIQSIDEAKNFLIGKISGAPIERYIQHISQNKATSDAHIIASYQTFRL